MEISSVLGGTRVELCENMPRDQYDAIPALNPSRLVNAIRRSKPLVLSARHFRWGWDHPRKDTDAMRWGRAVHTLLFERNLFPEQYTYWSERRQGKVWEAFRDEALAAGQDVLTANQYFDALVAAKRFVDEPLVQDLIRAGKPEVGVLACEEGLQCKGRMDWISSAGALVDLKTAASIESGAFGRSFFAYHYDVKLGLYQRWLSKVSPCQLPVTVICLENKPPFDVAVVPVPQAVLDEGVEKALRVIRLVKTCIETDRWPGIAGGMEYPLEVPQYVMDEEVEWEDEP